MKLCLFIFMPFLALLQSQASATECARLNPYTFKRELGTGSGSSAALVTKDNETMVMKIVACNSILKLALWKNENGNYNNLRNSNNPFLIRRKGEPFQCVGAIKENGTSFWPEPIPAFVLDNCLEQKCCYTLLERGKDFEYGQANRNRRTEDIRTAKTILFQLIWAHYKAFKDVGFQNWDLKEFNLLNGPWPSKEQKLCLEWGKNGYGCIQKTLAEDKIVKIFDFDMSSSGGYNNIPRFHSRGAAKKDAKGLLEIWNNIKPKKTDDDNQLKEALNDLGNVTPRADLAVIDPQQGELYKEAFEKILDLPYFDDILTD